jgi:hypothetical protein
MIPTTYQIRTLSKARDAPHVGLGSCDHVFVDSREISIGTESWTVHQVTHQTPQAVFLTRTMVALHNVSGERMTEHGDDTISRESSLTMVFGLLSDVFVVKMVV